MTEISVLLDNMKSFFGIVNLPPPRRGGGNVEFACMTTNRSRTANQEFASICWMVNSRYIDYRAFTAHLKNITDAAEDRRGCIDVEDVIYEIYCREGRTAFNKRFTPDIAATCQYGNVLDIPNNKVRVYIKDRKERPDAPTKLDALDEHFHTHSFIKVADVSLRGSRYENAFRTLIAASYHTGVHPGAPWPPSWHALAAYTPCERPENIFKFLFAYIPLFHKMMIDSSYGAYVENRALAGMFVAGLNFSSIIVSRMIQNKGRLGRVCHQGGCVDKTINKRKRTIREYLGGAEDEDNQLRS